MNKILDLRFTLFFMIIFVFTACDNSNHTKTSNSNAVNGYAQKGPFKKGSNVKAFKLVNGEKSTTFIETKVDDNKGTYNLDIPWVGPTLIEISGEYFNETDGTYIQNGFLTSIINIKENQKQNSNVNILTHLASKNIMKELKNNSSSIDEVIKTSDKKVANLFNLDLHEKNLKDLDLTNNKDEEIKKANAQLLKISAAILSTSNPKETLEKITEDFEEDGEINNAVDEFNELKQKEAQINLDEISSTMKNNLGLEDIPTNEVLEGTLSLNNNISFINLADVKPNTVVESNTITVEGVNLEAQISIENGEFQVDNEAFSSDTSSIKNGQTLRIRHTSANEFDKTKTTIVKIAGIEFKFTSTTQENTSKVINISEAQYSTKEKTNKDVKVTFVSDDDLTVPSTWQKQSNEYFKIYTENTNEKVIFEDKFGNSVEKTISISNIDKTAPILSQAQYSTKTLTNASITVTFTSESTDIVTPSGWDKNENSFSKVYLNNQIEEVSFSDDVGNITKKQIVISNIDKTAPTASIEYSTIENTNEDVIVTITLSEDVKELNDNSWKKEGKVFTKTFSSSANETITFTDLAGNTVEKTVAISNIDKSELSAEVVGISSTPTNQDVTVTLNFNKDIKTAQESWNKISNRSYSKVFAQDSTETVNFTDISNNIFTKQIVISNIDKTDPTASVEYSTIENTNEDVIVTITLSEDVIDLTDNSWKKEGKVFTKTFSSSANETITFTDLAGNTVEKTVAISNIDKSALNITSISPSNNSENIDIKTKFVVLFNKELATLEQNDIELLDALDNVISTNIVVTNNKVEIISDSDLEYLKVYKLKISSNIKDISNNSLSQEQTYTFKTTKKSGTHYDANGLVYNEIVSPRTGSIWLDRNLGASAVCTTKDDANCIGDFFQWGRLMNGHEKRNSEVSATRIDVDSQENNKFIKANGYGTSSWSNNKDETLWSGVNASNNICPEGFKVPSIDELKAELFSLNDSFDSEFLKIPNSSYRQTNSGEIYSNISSSNNTQLYSSTLLNNNINPQAKALKYDSYKSKYVLEEKDLRSGLNVRCIKDYTDDTLPEILEIKTGNNILSNNQTEIDVNDNITVKFSEFLKEDTLTSDNINLTKDDNILGFKSSFIKNGNEVIFTSTLSYGSSYTLHINTNIEDISGNKLKEEKIIKFTTENEPDTTPVKLDSNKSSLGVSLSDSRNVGISIKNNIEIYFNEPIDISTLTKENFVIENANYNLELDNTKQKVTISFNADLNYNTRYNLLLKKEILDLSGNGFDGSGYGYGTSNKEIPFTTQDVADTKAPSIISTSVNDGDSNISVSKSLLITFDEEVKDYDNSAIILKEFNTNTIVNTTNTYLDKVVIVKPNSTLSENTLYKLIVNTNIKDTSDNALETDYEISFTTGSSISCDGKIINDICYKVSTEKKSWEEAKNNCELQNKTLVQKDSVSDFVELANTLNLNTNESYWLYEGKSGTYKQATYLRYNQWSNPAWSTTTGYNDSTYYYICKSDKVSPIATLEKPTSLADVSTKAKFEIVFNEDVKNIDTSSIELTNSSNELIPLTVSYENKILTIQANSDLNISSTYTITLKNTITDFYNNALEEKTFSFTTSSVASNCDGAEIDGKCYTLVSEEKTYNEANAHCTLLSKDTSVDLTNLATQLNLKDKDTSYNPIYYWLKEKDSWGYGHTLYKGYSGWSTTSTKAASSNYQFICVE
ncbi:Ig-like domain-containing protein [Arcobacter sp. YIC-80]|uniref:Ig-like domain-containing protein n=1 Tax=Arcobacter sp. YIC-80 TaxID=3376683 RepID=UPI0038508A17